MSGILVKRYEPHPALKDLIRHFVVIDADLGSLSVPRINNFMPSPDQAMFINLFTRFKSKRKGDTQFSTSTSCTITGPVFSPVKLLVEESHKAVSVVFQPGGLHRFIGIPLTEIRNDGCSARELIGREIDELLHKCHDHPSFNMLNQIVQGYFLRKLGRVKDSLPLDRALLYLMNNHNANISEVAGMACLSLRQFERKCDDRLGMSPKTFARITRFSKAYRMFEKGDSPNWTSIAYNAGYFDQMHFIRDFKDFAGLTPSVIQKENSSNHIQLQLEWDRL